MEHALRFSAKNPFLQIKINSSSLGEFMQCERKYFYGIVLGYIRKGLQKDLDFGTLAHEGVCLFHKFYVTMPYERALLGVLKVILPKAQKQLSYYSSKNPHSLGRFLVWYLDKYERSGRGPKTAFIAGEPAVELPFEFSTGLRTSSDEDITLFGTIDRLVWVGDQIYPKDLKTTSGAITHYFAEGFSPNSQFTLYTIATEVISGWKPDGLILDAAQIGQNFIRLQNFIVPRPRPVLDEWLRSLRYYLLLMQICANNAQIAGDNFSLKEAAYPQRDKNCGLYGGCQFRQICSRAPQGREQILAIEFEKRADTK